MTLEGFTRSNFSYDNKTYPIYRRGTGPGVVIIHEIPGITPQVAEFAKIVADDGFTVILPHLFGSPGKKLSVFYAASEMAKACISKEFHVLANRQSSPITNYLRALCREAHKELGGSGVGALGMCLTGNFALSLMVDSSVMAPVLSQPSLPMGPSAAQKHGLHISDEDLQTVKMRVNKEGRKVLALRFSHDMACPGARFKRLKEELGDGLEDIVIDSGPNNPDGISRFAHSVLTTHLINKEGHPTLRARDRVLEFFHEQLDATYSNAQNQATENNHVE